MFGTCILTIWRFLPDHQWTTLWDNLPERNRNIDLPSENRDLQIVFLPATTLKTIRFKLKLLNRDRKRKPYSMIDVRFNSASLARMLRTTICPHHTNLMSVRIDQRKSMERHSRYELAPLIHLIHSAPQLQLLRLVGEKIRSAPLLSATLQSQQLQ